MSVSSLGPRKLVVELLTGASRLNASEHPAQKCTATRAENINPTVAILVVSIMLPVAVGSVCRGNYTG